MSQKARNNMRRDSNVVLRYGARKAWALVQKYLSHLLTSKKETDIIKEGNKFPIDAGHWGFLPHNVYNFLNITDTDGMCNIDGDICILRQGVQYSETQSFIATIARIYGIEEIPTIKEMKNIIVDAITLDSFITYQHGTLVQLFKNDEVNKFRGAIAPKYKDTQIYKKFMGKKT